MKKRFGAALLALCFSIHAFALAEAGDESSAAEDISAFGVTVIRNHEVKTGSRQKLALDYPTFESENAALQQFLTDSITTPILALRKLGQMAEDEAYADGQLDAIRSGYFASLDFENLLSVEASVSNRPAGAAAAETSFFYRLIDLAGSRILTVEELFTEPAEAVRDAVAQAVFAKAGSQGVLLPSITEAGAVPAPNSYYLSSEYFRTIFAAGAISENAVVVDIPWNELPLTPSELLTPAGGAGEPMSDPLDTPEPAGTASQDGEPTTAPEPADAAGIRDGAGDGATAAPAAPAIDPNFSLAPVQTPTPMPVAGNDAIIVDVLTHGLWKELGSDGETYYQFTADGKLLTVQVSDYAVADGMLSSGPLSGSVDVGSDSAFTLREADGAPRGYVLNREGEAVAPEELVTPSPTPMPTPTPAPSPTPTLAPTPAPTPTLSPYEAALSQAPSLAALGDASFEKARTLKVYSAPKEDAYRDGKAQVTTDESVAIYGVTGEWVLVSYTIGNGSKGRIGYIENTTLNAPDEVARLNLASIEMTLSKDADATDDPLNGKATIAKLKKGDKVTLLAFMGSDWAYIQTTHEDKPCRLFIPQAALMED